MRRGRIASCGLSGLGFLSRLTTVPDPKGIGARKLRVKLQALERMGQAARLNLKEHDR